MLKRNAPSRTQLMIGSAVLALIIVDVCALAWSAQPPRIVNVAEATSLRTDASRVKLLGAPDRYDETDLAGGNEQFIDEAAIQDQVREALADAQRALLNSQHAMDRDAPYFNGRGEALNLSDEEIAEINEEAHRGIAEAQQELRRAQEEMRRDFAEARRDELASARDARRDALDAREASRGATPPSEAMAELRRLGMEMGERASELVRLSLEDGDRNEAEADALEAEMEAGSARIEELARQVEAERRAYERSLRTR